MTGGDKPLQRLQPLVRHALRARIVGATPLQHMARYHFGWGPGPVHSSGGSDDGLRVSAGPAVEMGALGCLVAETCGAPAERALPAAAAVELLKAADDIHQDLLLGRPQRGGRSAVWWAFGHAQAINAGDGLYALARLTAMDVVEAGGADAAVRTLARMDEAWWARCLEREARREEEGVQRQAARSLTALATALGSQAAGAPPEVTAGLELFGRELGAALHRNEEMDGFFNSTGEDLLRMLDEGGPEILLKPVRSLPPGERVVLDAVVQRRQPVDDAALAAVREVVERAGGRARLQEAIDGHLKEALAALGSIPDSAPLARAAHELLS